MKLAGITTILGIALLTGCAAPKTQPQAPKTASADDGPQSTFVLPADYGTPGSMEVSWEPTPPPPAKEEKAEKNSAKPHFVSTKKRSLFALPMTRGN